VLGREMLVRLSHEEAAVVAGLNNIAANRERNISATQRPGFRSSG